MALVFVYAVLSPEAVCEASLLLMSTKKCFTVTDEVAFGAMWFTVKRRSFTCGNAGAGLDFGHAGKRADPQRGTITSGYPAAETANTYAPTLFDSSAYKLA
jgi:hypothetical protein